MNCLRVTTYILIKSKYLKQRQPLEEDLAFNYYYCIMQTMFILFIKKQLSNYGFSTLVIT